MFDFAMVGVAFWAWLAAVVIAEENGKTKRRRADLDLIRFAIEKGQPLSPDVLQQLFVRPPTPFLLSGIVTMAAGIGLIIFSLFLAQITQRGGLMVAGAGAIAICVGAGLIIGHRFNRAAAAAVKQS